MKVRVGLIAVIVVWSSGAEAQLDSEQEAPPILTLAQAVELALQHNVRLLDSQDTVTQPNLGVRLARSEFRPKVTPNVLGSFDARAAVEDAEDQLRFLLGLGSDFRFRIQRETLIRDDRCRGPRLCKTGCPA